MTDVTSPILVKYRFLGILLVVAAILLVFFSIRPLQQNVSLLELEADTLQIDKTEDKIENMGDIAKQELLRSIPEGLEQDIILANFGSLAAENGLSVQSLSFHKRNSEDIVKRIFVSTSLRGTLQDFSRFLKSLETSPRKSIVSEFNVQQIERRGALSLINVNLGIEYLYQ